MYLSKLELLGFKSFANKTTVNFTSGLTGIVGPNGCGKTNIVDAIRWCLGEQKSHTLRSDKMENVIFNGTASKKPIGMSEVSLTIQNDKGILPSEYTEVVITRRIFRSGDSEYLLNRNICRLKDITNLFMDTGMGANAYSVIELKMIESILNNKADERRTMFEEAAGVNKYKQRRRWTLKKLEDAKADLARVSDIISEVEKKVNSLERQAKRADRHNKVSTLLRELEIDLCEREFALFARTRSEQKTAREESFALRLKTESDIARDDDRLKGLRNTLTGVEDNLVEKRHLIRDIVERIHKIEQTSSITLEQKKALERNIIQFGEDITELEKQIAAVREETARYGEEGKVNETLTGDKKEAARIVALEAEDKKGAVDTAREALKQQNEKVVAAHRELVTMENSSANIDATVTRVNQSIEKTNAAIQTLTDHVAKTVAFIEELTQEKNETERRLQEAESEYQSKQEEKSRLELELAALRKEEVETRGVITTVSDKIQFLQNVIDNLEGFSKGAKALLEDGTWHTGSKTLLANIGNTDERFRFAIEASLKNMLNSIITESIEDIRKGISMLERTGQGKAAFYLHGDGSVEKKSFAHTFAGYFASRKRKKIAKQEGFLGWSNEIIQTDEKWRPLFNKLLSGIGVVGSLQTAFDFANRFPGYSFVTVQGDFIDASGMIEGGAMPKIDETLFGRRQMLEELKRAVPGHQQKLASLSENITVKEADINAIDMKVFADKSRMLINDLANLEKQIHQFEFEKNKALADTAASRAELEGLIEQINELSRSRARLDGELTTYRKTVAAVEGEAGMLELSFKSAEEAFTAVTASINILNLELERLAGEKRNLDSAIQRNDENIVTLTASIERRRAGILSAETEIEALANHLVEQAEALSRSETTHAALQAEEAVIDKQFQELRAVIRSTEDAIAELRQERDRLSELIHSAEMKLNEISIKVENLIEHIREMYSHQLELKSYDDLDSFEFQARTAEVNSLKQQIKNLGPVNSLAFSEFEEERQRLEFMQKQRDDLLASERDLIKTIEEINVTAQNLFMETFEKIRQNFINIFRNLFNPGDEADLKLEEHPDPLEAKIEIVAKPKGKRPSVIELLSGGEKTLTAIALLFAIYLVKPSPFCILDEIDAPLDDANIDRFTGILRDFSKNTQFIVVTHNKRTMEATDALYGVTMQEEGISKLVSVRFNEDMNIVA